MERQNSPPYKEVRSDLGIDISRLEEIKNANVRRVALLAKETKELRENDPIYNVRGTYSEAYSGEQ